MQANWVNNLELYDGELADIAGSTLTCTGMSLSYRNVYQQLKTKDNVNLIYMII